MRWKLETYRIIKKFAWFPCRIGRESRWLETVYIRQYSYKGRISDNYYWDNDHFTTKEHYEKYKKGELT